ncbi:hypothetical protein W97_05759 [Coniosporium apollinis CBS 100218]|uniref:Store-operated calcium entry-associated regulatory factor n=1 Tax=Coniosporium apollinis (strain CBS 100218) TaxID=1168221 RepID=R7YXI1_CONA1|nr:uncharacterized protein W97_05759 [Coniosporium apollinis CBS 100218]EON66514.1 hypothetical protein W97_05759 [Coniosporium apollinis CBS 100218]
MHYRDFVYAALLALGAFTTTISAARNPANSVLLSSIQSLTLRSNLKTTARRVSAIPQLKCIGGSGKGLYEVDTMRCRNSGSSYDDANIEWTCTASLPPEFKLGSTDVICEGYDSPDDPYILKGSCGVEYRLVLTEKGEEKYGRRGGSGWNWGSGNDEKHGETGVERTVSLLFWCLFIGVAIWMVWSAFIRPRMPGEGPAGGNRPGWGGGGADDNDPPPPYDYQPPRSNKSSWSSFAGRPQQQGWRPGFWSGALGGAAAGYMAGNRGNQTRYNRDSYNRTGSWGGGGGSSWNNGEGSSGGSSGSSASSTRYESTGFGSTSRR